MIFSIKSNILQTKNTDILTLFFIMKLIHRATGMNKIILMKCKHIGSSIVEDVANIKEQERKTRDSNGRKQIRKTMKTTQNHENIWLKQTEKQAKEAREQEQ